MSTPGLFQAWKMGTLPHETRPWSLPLQPIAALTGVPCIPIEKDTAIALYNSSMAPSGQDDPGRARSPQGEPGGVRGAKRSQEEPGGAMEVFPHVAMREEFLM